MLTFNYIAVIVRKREEKENTQQIQRLLNVIKDKNSANGKFLFLLKEKFPSSRLSQGSENMSCKSSRNHVVNSFIY